jgi:hypothetical protein
MYNLRTTRSKEELERTWQALVYEEEITEVRRKIRHQ